LQQRQRWRLKPFPWIRFVITIIALLLIAIGTFLSLHGIIQSSTILTILGVVIGLFQWLFPIPSSIHGSHTTASTQHLSQQSPLDLLNEQLPLSSIRSPLWNIPYQRNLFFTGREDVLKRLHDALTTGEATALTQPQAISGLGGIGKTQTAIEYAYRYRSNYQAILWVKADSPETLVSDFVTIADLMKLAEKQEQDQNRIVAGVKRWLEANTGWLLIFDNADDLTMVNSFIPSLIKGHILLTTRAQAVGSIAHCIEIEKMEMEEGALFLLRRARIIAKDTPPSDILEVDWVKAKAISKAVDCLPLALDQAGAYIEETACGLSGYLNIYQSQRSNLLNRRGRLVYDHPEPVATTWSLSFEKIEQVNSAAAELLRLCSFLYPDDIPEEIITIGAADLGPVLQLAAMNPFELDTSIEELRKFSLLRRDPDAKTLTVHRLVQAVLKDQMDEKSHRQWAERTVRALYQAFPPVEYTTWQSCQKYLPHVQVCATLIKEWDIQISEAAQLLIQAGKYLHERAQYVEAEPLIVQSLSIQESMLGPEHLDVATNLNILAVLYHNQGKHAEAELLYKRALAIREQILGPEHPDVATCFHNLALLYDYQGKYTLAEPLLLTALAIRKKTLGLEHCDVASSLNGLAELYRDQGKYPQAELLYQQALIIFEKTLGPEHPNVAKCLTNLALLYDYQGKYIQAEPLYQQALDISEKMLGLEHPSFASTLNALALLYHHQGKYPQAELLYQQALAIREQSLGPEHRDVAQSLNNIATLYYTQGKYAQAEQLCQRALIIREKVLGLDHPDVATSLNTLAKLYHKQGRYSQAEQLYQRALTIRENTLGSEHPRISPTLTGLAELYCDQGKFTLAEQFCRKALIIRENTLGPEHPLIIENLNILVEIYYSQGNYAEAEIFCQRALAICEKTLGPDHPDMAFILEDYAKLLRKTNRKREAVTFERRAKIIQVKLHS